MVLHAYDAVKVGLAKVMMRTVDTDVVVIAISFAKEINISEFWIAFGAGKHYIYLAIHEIAFSLGPSKSRGLLFFHAFT